MSKSSSITIGPFGFLMIIIILNWVFSDDDTGNKKVDEVRGDVNEVVDKVVDKVKDKIESDTTYKATSDDFESDEYKEDIEWADE